MILFLKNENFLKLLLLYGVTQEQVLILAPVRLSTNWLNYLCLTTFIFIVGEIYVFHRIVLGLCLDNYR